MNSATGAEGVRILLARHRCIDSVRPGKGRVLILESIPGIIHVYRWTDGQPSIGRKVYSSLDTALRELDTQGWLDEEHRWSPSDPIWELPPPKGSDDALIAGVDSSASTGGLPSMRRPLWTPGIDEAPVHVGQLAELLRKEYEDGCHDRTVPGGLADLIYHHGPLPLRMTMRLRAYRSTPMSARPRVIEGLWRLLHNAPLAQGDGDCLAGVD